MAKKKEILSATKLKDVQEDIGIRIKILREKHGLTLKQVSHATGISVPLLSQLENGHVNISIANLLNIAQALDVEVGYFFQQDLGQDFEVIRSDKRKDYEPNHALP